MLKLKQNTIEAGRTQGRVIIMALSRAPASSSVLAMILLACCGLMLAAAAATDADADADGGDKLMLDRFRRWKATYSRSYASEEESRRRFQVYRRNIEFIEATNRAGNLTYTLGENQFADLTEEEFLDLHTMKEMPSLGRDAGQKKGTPDGSLGRDAGQKKGSLGRDADQKKGTPDGSLGRDTGQKKESLGRDAGQKKGSLGHDAGQKKGGLGHDAGRKKGGPWP